MQNKISSILKFIAPFLLGLLIIFVILFLFGLFFLKGDFSGKIYSPNKNYFAIVTNARFDHLSGVTLTNAKAPLHDWSLVNKIFGNSVGVLTIEGNQPNISAQWLDNNTIEISYDCKVDVHDRDESWKDIKIVYKNNCLSPQ